MRMTKLPGALLAASALLFLGPLAIGGAQEAGDAEEAIGTYDQTGDDTGGRRIVVEAAEGEGLTFLFLTRREAGVMECEQADGGGLSCSDESGDSVTLEMGSGSVALTYGDGTLELPRVAAESGSDYGVYRDRIDDSTLVTAVVRPITEPQELELSEWRHHFVQTAGPNDAGNYEVNDSGTTLELSVDPDRIDVMVQGETALRLERVEY